MQVDHPALVGHKGSGGAYPVDKYTASATAAHSKRGPTSRAHSALGYEDGGVGGRDGYYDRSDKKI